MTEQSTEAGKSLLKPPEQLTESERFALALDAGVPIKETVCTRTGVKLILEPCAISIVDGKYLVAWRRSK